MNATDVKELADGIRRDVGKAIVGQDDGVELMLIALLASGHILLEVLSSFVIDSGNAGAGWGLMIGVPSFILMIGISALELLVCVIQAYVFALLTSLYINDAVNLH